MRAGCAWQPPTWSLGISCWIGAQIEEEGSITVPARLLSDLVNTLPNDNVQLSVNMHTYTLSVRCGASFTEIKGIDAQEFPPMPARRPGRRHPAEGGGLQGDDPAGGVCCLHG